MDEIANIEEFEKKYHDEWLVIEVLEENELGEPIKGKLIAHSKVRDEVHKVAKKIKSDLCIFFSGSIPKKGYAFAF